jgi:hypothetical protein
LERKNMSELELPIIDRDRGFIVKDVNVDGYSVGTGWYVHFIPDKEDKEYARWRQSDKLTKWCDSELVVLPEEKLPDDVDEEYVLGVLEKILIEDGLSGCKRCGTTVPVGSLENDGSDYVATLCPDCANACPECGGTEWEHLGKKKAHSARHGARHKCEECGYVREDAPTA